MKKFVLLPDPIHYTNETKVISSHSSLDLAVIACNYNKREECVIRETHSKMKCGSKWLSIYDEFSPIIYSKGI